MNLKFLSFQLTQLNLKFLSFRLNLKFLSFLMFLKNLKFLSCRMFPKNRLVQRWQMLYVCVNTYLKIENKRKLDEYLRFYF